MASEKLCISMPADLVDQIDFLAEQLGSSRSYIMREAAAKYLASVAAQTEAARRRSSVEQSLETFEAVATAWGDDDRQGQSYLDEVRDTGDASQRSRSGRKNG